MKKLEERIKADGIVLPGDVLKVDSFVNHNIDVPFMCEAADELVKLYNGSRITKVLTVEASGIGFACLVAERLNVPVLFAKKNKSSNIADEVFSAEVASYTHGVVNHIIINRKYLGPDDSVLIVDDFLATGSALLGLISLCRDAGAEVAGCGVVIEKAYQPGGAIVRKLCRVEALARIGSMDPEEGFTFI